MIKSRARQTWARMGTASRIGAPEVACSRIQQDQPIAGSSQLSSILAGGGRSRIRTWEGVADSFTDLRRECSYLRKRGSQMPLGHVLGTSVRLRRRLFVELGSELLVHVPLETNRTVHRFVEGDPLACRELVGCCCLN